MAASAPSTALSVEAYLAQERGRTLKHEYREGQAYAMAGASDAHVRLTLNLASLLNGHLRGSGCLTYASDMKVHIAMLDCFYYPDVLVTCSPADRELTYYKQQPKLIVEVLSETTEAFDRSDKFDDYQQLDSLEEYVLVSQHRQRVEVFRRTPENLWLRYVYRAGEVMELASVGWQGSLAELYADVPGLAVS